MKVAIITDSNSGITQEEGKQLGIRIVPMPFMINGEEYLEDITLTQQEFYAKLGEGSDISTSQPSPESIMALWDEVLEEYDEIVQIPMSSGLSGSCQTAMMLAEDYDGKVEVVNNQRISVTQRQSALDAKELAAKGMCAAEIKEKLEAVKFDSSIYITLDTLKYLKKGGRIAVLTFQSLEDRAVKEAFKYLECPCTCPKNLPVCVCGKKPSVRLVHKKPIVSGARELEENPRARSAKLRVAEKL